MTEEQRERRLLLSRKNIGRYKLDDYKQFFKGFNLKELKYIELEQSDKIRTKATNIFSSIEKEYELTTNAPRENSILLSEVLENISYGDRCYIFTEEVDLCGMFIATTKSAIEACLEIAFLTYNNTCILIDSNYSFSFTINYCDNEDLYDKDKFDIQRTVLKEIN